MPFSIIVWRFSYECLFCRVFRHRTYDSLGNGVVANVCLDKTKGQSSGWIVITTAWAFAVYVAVVVVGPYSGAHLNPAVTLGLAAKGVFDWGLVPGYVIAQVFGGMVGALLVYIMYRNHFLATENEGSKRACFCTEPAIRHYPSNLVSEIIGTFVLIFVISISLALILPCRVQPKQRLLV
ncbi:glycerol uptake facilitator protein [Rodentibacter pneumotropicus]|uniref:Glycerol uptake facilitator protein n=1 Tax=Rodentibacter pneumotropicus TaxID=758 RepID=A0A3S4TSQ0_9PAST|nr:glycerol uptake facilitator protein [Rodentibacter pneumotropicus]